MAGRGFGPAQPREVTMQDVWYVLEDGAVADPAEVMTQDDGRLRHKSGVMVAERAPGVPRTRGVDASTAIARDMKPAEPARGYKTRESKAR